jgi:hypothetical protein
MTDLLANLAIASPCRAEWSAMAGDDKRRFCADCKLHVHDLSAMTTAEAHALLRAAGGGRVCVRFHRRADGRVLTRDCPIGLRQRMRAAWARAAALVCALWSTAAACARPRSDASDPAPAAAAPVDQDARMGRLMGEVMPPSPPAQRSPAPPIAPSPPAGPRTPIK